MSNEGNGFDDVAAQNADKWAREAGGRAGGQGMTSDQSGSPRQYRPGNEYDSQGEEPYGRRGTPPEYEPPQDRSDRQSSSLDEEGRYGEEQPHLP